MQLLLCVSRHTSGLAVRRLATSPRSFTSSRVGAGVGARCSWSELRRPKHLLLDSIFTIYNLYILHVMHLPFTYEVSLISIDIHE